MMPNTTQSSWLRPNRRLRLRRVGRAGEAPMEGVQFHPESFLTEEGPRLLGNFLAMVREWDGAATA